jgi:hypothetical protein
MLKQSESPHNYRESDDYQRRLTSLQAYYDREPEKYFLLGNDFFENSIPTVFPELNFLIRRLKENQDTNDEEIMSRIQQEIKIIFDDFISEQVKKNREQVIGNFKKRCKKIFMPFSNS